jgi:non-structural maintenance of chromosomes element 4
MARRINIALSTEEEEKEKEMRSARSRAARVSTIGSPSPSPTASFSSDKENHSARLVPARQTSLRSRAVSPQKLPTPTSAEPSSPRSNKRRKLGERDGPNPSQRAHERELQDSGNAEFYDPDQSMEERRAVRKGIRDLSKELNGEKLSHWISGKTIFINPC